MTKIDGEFFPCMVSAEIIQLRKVAGDFATDEEGQIYRYLPGELNEARQVTNFDTSEGNSLLISEANSVDERMEYYNGIMECYNRFMEYVDHNLDFKKKGSRFRIYSTEDFLDYLRVTSKGSYQ